MMAIGSTGGPEGLAPPGLSAFMSSRAGDWDVSALGGFEVCWVGGLLGTVPEVGVTAAGERCVAEFVGKSSENGLVPGLAAERSVSPGDVKLPNGEKLPFATVGMMD